MTINNTGVLGATSFVGDQVLSQLNQADWPLFAYSRQARHDNSANVQWCNPNDTNPGMLEIPYWLCLAPIWILPDYFSLLEQHQVRRIVALSSTSRFTKTHSSEASEQKLAKQIADAEHCLQAWAESKNIDWIILRPTLIYGYGKDANISVIASFIKRFRFFPVFGRAQGLRQPIHVDDVVQASLSALTTPEVRNKAYNISGAECVTYRDMVCRVFMALKQVPLIVSVPINLFRLVVACLRLLPKYRHWTAAMAERMSQDLMFTHDEASRDLNFAPRSFQLSAKDLPK